MNDIKLNINDLKTIASNFKNECAFGDKKDAAFHVVSQILNLINQRIEEQKNEAKGK